MAQSLDVNIYLPERLVATKSSVSQVNLPTIDKGYIGILPHHTQVVTEVGTGVLAITEDGKTKPDEYFVSGGFAWVGENNVELMLDIAEHCTKINKTRAQKAKERAEARLAAKTHSEKESVDIARAQAALLRALQRISVSERHGL